MPRDKTIKILRTTRANLNSQKNANGLLQGEPYLITDENRLAIGTAANNYEDLAKKSEVDAKKTDNVSANSKILGRKTSGSGVIEELTLSEVLDFIGSAAPGDILYRGASSWARLPKGTDGQVLTLASGLPSWAAGGGGGGAAKYAQRTSNFTNTTTSFIDITGMSFNVESGKKYYLSMYLNLVNYDYQMDDSALAYIKIIMPGGYLGISISNNYNNAGLFSDFGFAYGDLICYAPASTSQYYQRRLFLGIFNCSSPGTLKLQLAASHNGIFGSSLITGSFMTLQEVTT